MKKHRAVLLMAALAISMHGCDDGGDDPLAMSALLYSPQGSSIGAFDQVQFVALKVSGDDLPTPAVSVAPYNFAGGGVLVPEVPYPGLGATRQLTIEGWLDQAGTTVLSRGRSVPVEVTPSSGLQNLYVYFGRTNSFYPLTNVSQLAPQSLTRGRVGHTVTVTNQNQVIIAGGGVPDEEELGRWWLGEGLASQTSVEIIDETLNDVSPHNFCNSELCNTGKIPPAACDLQGCMDGMNYARIWHTATALPTGQVVIAGGYTDDLFGKPVPLADTAGGGIVEVFHPGLGQKMDILSYSLSKPRAGHSATLIDPINFQVLIVGGDLDGQATWEIWNPYSGSSGPQVLPDATPRRHHTATLFDVPGTGGQAVLIAGGESETAALDSILIYSVSEARMVAHPTGMVKGPRTQLSAGIDRENGYIYLVGGFIDVNHTTPSQAIDVYDVTIDQCLTEAQGLNLTTARGALSTAVTVDGSLVITGGAGTTGAALSTAEGIHKYLTVDANGQYIQKIEHAYLEPIMPTGRFGHRTVTTNTGLVLLVGGLQGGASEILSPVLSLDVYNPK